MEDAAAQQQPLQSPPQSQSQSQQPQDKQKQQQQQQQQQQLEVGDHVYQWRKFGFVPYVFQHHGIVMDLQRDIHGNVTKLVIADFSNVEPTTSKTTTNNNKTKQLQKHHDGSSSSLASSSSSIIGATGGEESSDDYQCQHEQNDDENEQPNVQVESTPTIPQHASTSTTTTTATASAETLDPTTTMKRYSSTDNNNNTSSSRHRPPRRNHSLGVSLVQEGIFRTYTDEDIDTWYKVEYGASWIQRQISRSGTVTKSQSGSVGLILARVHFIIQHPDILPDYHVIHANCECVAFWCRTGVWSSLQGSSFLELTTAGQVKSSVTLATAAATTQASVTVPSAGLWGWLGYTTTSQVSWVSLHPMAIPGLACYAALTIGVPAVYYATAHTQWKKTTNKLNDAFWNNATELPDVFAECITHWSDKNS